MPTSPLTRVTSSVSVRNLEVGVEVPSRMRSTNLRTSRRLPPALLLLPLPVLLNQDVLWLALTVPRLSPSFSQLRTLEVPLPTTSFWPPWQSSLAFMPESHMMTRSKVPGSTISQAPIGDAKKSGEIDILTEQDGFGFDAREGPSLTTVTAH